METLKRAVSYMQQVDKNGEYDALLKEVEDGDTALTSAKAYCVGVLRRWREDTDNRTIRSLLNDLLGLESPLPTNIPKFVVDGHMFEEKFLVLKWSDIGSLLNMADQYLLLDMLNKINNYRKLEGKKDNTYLVINTDESYAPQIAKILVAHSHCVNTGHSVEAGQLDYRSCLAAKGNEGYCEYWDTDEGCPEERKGKLTNADYIRSISDEELASELTRSPAIPCRMCDYYNNEFAHCDADCWFACTTEYAKALTLNWLEQPVKEEIR